MRVIRTLLVGMGQMGRHHFRVLREDPRFDLIGVVDPVLATLPETSPPLLRTIDEAWDLPFELAVIAAPTEHHASLVEAVLAHGRHVLVEKPAAATAAVARSLVAAAEKRGLCFAVGQIERCNPVVGGLREVVASGLLGQLVHVAGVRAGGYPPQVKSGNNVIYDLAVHELDVFRMLLGPLKILQSLGHATRPSGIIDTADISLVNATGVTGQVHVSWLSPDRVRTIRLTGTRGVADVDYIAQSVRIGGVGLEKSTALPLEWQVDAQGVARASLPVTKQETLKIQLDQLHRYLNGEDHRLAIGEALIESVELIEQALARALGQKGLS